MRRSTIKPGAAPLLHAVQTLIEAEENAKRLGALAVSAETAAQGAHLRPGQNLLLSEAFLAKRAWVDADAARERAWAALVAINKTINVTIDARVA